MKRSEIREPRPWIALRSIQAKQLMEEDAMKIHETKSKNLSGKKGSGIQIRPPSLRARDVTAARETVYEKNHATKKYDPTPRSPRGK
jgi:hypothetical protein